MNISSLSTILESNSGNFDPISCELNLGREKWQKYRTQLVS